MGGMELAAEREHPGLVGGELHGRRLSLLDDGRDAECRNLKAMLPGGRVVHQLEGDFGPLGDGDRAREPELGALVLDVDQGEGLRLGG